MFHRERANTHLTDLGRTIRPHLQQIYDEAQSAKRLAQDITKLKKVSLKLGIMCTIAPTQLIDLITSVQTRHDAIEIEITDEGRHRVKDLNGMSYVNRAKCEFNGYAGQFFQEQGVECKTVYRSERDDWVLAMIRSGLGFGFMPEFTVTDPAVIARPLVEPEFWRVVNLCTVRGRPHSPAVGALVREAMRVCWNGRPAMAVTQVKGKHGSEPALDLR